MPTYQETQKINMLWVYALLIPIVFYLIYGVYQQVIKGIPFGNNPAPDAILIGSVLLVLGIITSIAMVNMRTKITHEGVEVRYLPFGKQKLFWSEVESWSIGKMKNLGAGVKYNPVKNLKYFNVKPGDMLFLRLKTGRTIGIGTQDPERMTAFINSIGEDEASTDLLEDLKNRPLRLRQKAFDERDFVK